MIARCARDGAGARALQPTLGLANYVVLWDDGDLFGSEIDVNGQVISRGLSRLCPLGVTVPYGSGISDYGCVTSTV